MSVTVTAGLATGRTMSDRPPTETPRALTRRQRDILEHVVEYVEEHGYSPNIREIQAAADVSSTSVVSYSLNALQAAGYLRRAPGLSRSIVLLPAAYRLFR